MSDKAAPISSIIADDAKQVSAFLETYFADKTGPAKQLLAAMSYASLNGGKRIRACLCLSAARLVAPDDKAALDRAIIAAAALEMVHAYSLVHDDLPAMDDADLRRGAAATHIAFDEATAILAGDALQTEAFDLLATPHHGLSADNALTLVKILASASGVDGMAGGQMLDLLADERAAAGQALSQSETETMQAMKTGALIIAAPMMGAIAAGASDDVISNLRDFATPLGLAFQIADDLLDVTANDETAGKPVGRDKEQGKASFIDFYGVDGARQMAADLMAKSVAALAPYREKSEPLRQIAYFVINRSH